MNTVPMAVYHHDRKVAFGVGAVIGGLWGMVAGVLMYRWL